MGCSLTVFDVFSGYGDPTESAQSGPLLPAWAYPDASCPEAVCRRPNPGIAKAKPGQADPIAGRVF